jgi:hypothetical protein
LLLLLLAAAADGLAGRPERVREVREELKEGG